MLPPGRHSALVHLSFRERRVEENQPRPARRASTARNHGDLVSLPVSHSAKPVRSAKISSTEGSKRTSIASDALTFCAASCRAAGADRTEGHALKKRKLRCLQPPRAANSYLMFMCRLLVAVNRANLNLILLAKVASRFLFMNFMPSIEKQNTHFNVMKGQ